MFRRLVVSGFGPHVSTDIQIPTGRVEFAGPSESGKTTLIDAMCWLMWGVGRDGKAPTALYRGEVVVEGVTSSATYTRKRTAAGTTSVRIDGEAVDVGPFTERFGGAKRLTVDTMLPILAPFGWLDMAEGPGAGREFREWLVDNIDGPSLGSVLEDLRHGEAEGKDHAGRVKTAAAAVTRARKALDRQQGMLDEAERSTPTAPVEPDPERVEQLRAAKARHDEQTQAQADARAAVRVWQAAVSSHRKASDEARRWDDAKAALVAPKAARPAAEALTEATDAKVRTKQDEDDARRTANLLRADIEHTRRDVDVLDADLKALGPAPQAGGCSGVAATKCSIAKDGSAAAERHAARFAELTARRDEAVARLTELEEKLPEATRAVTAAEVVATDHRNAFLALQDAQLKWGAYDDRLAKLGPRPTVPEDPGPQPKIPDVDPMPDDAHTVLQYETQLAYHRRDLAARETRIRDLTEAARLAREALHRAEHVLDLVRSAPGRVLGPRLAQIDMGPVTILIGDDGDSLAVRIDGRPWRCASRGRQVVADAWLRAGLRAAVGGLKWLPIVVDEVESATGERQALPPGLLWTMRSTPNGGLTARAVEAA